MAAGRGRALRAAALLALVAGSAALATRLRVSPDPTEHFAGVSPRVTQWLELSRRFDAFNVLVVGLEEPAGPTTAEGLRAVKQVTDALAELKADGVLSVASLTNVDSIHEGEDGALETELLIPRVPTEEAELVTLRQRVAADEQVSGALVSRDQRGYLVLVRADARKDSVALAALVRRTVEAHRGPLTSAYVGAAFVSEFVMRAALGAMPWLTPLCAAVLLGALAVVRRWRQVLAVFGGAVAALVVWLGLLGASGLTLGVSSLTAGLGVLGVAVAAFARRLEGDSRRAVLTSVVAAGLAALPLWWSPIAFVSGFGLGMSSGALAVLLVGLLLPWTSGAETVGARPRRAVVGAAVGLTLVLGIVATRASFHVTPQAMFSADDEVGRSLAFFDRRFGGADVFQVAVRGDLRDPAIAARLFRLTQLLEGSRAFGDVRSVGQVLGFLNQSFGGVHRIPTTRESLGNLWFFLEGRADVRSLVSDARDETMVVLRVPSRPTRPVSELVQVVEQAVRDSLQLGEEGGKARLMALARTFEVSLSEGAVDAVVRAAVSPRSPQQEAAGAEAARAKLRTWLASPDAPYTPTDDEWMTLEAALAAPEPERAQSLKRAAASMPEVASHADAFVDTLLARLREQQTMVFASELVGRLGVGAPEVFRVRAEGVLFDLLEPTAGTGEAASVAVTGLPVIARSLSEAMVSALWRALLTLLGVGALVQAVLTRRPSEAAQSALAAAMASVSTLAVVGTFGPGLDAGCVSALLAAPLVTGLAYSGPLTTRLRTSIVLALSAFACGLAAVGIEPLLRFALAAVTGLGLASASSRTFLTGTRDGRESVV